jgi:hypothetical protein
VDVLGLASAVSVVSAGGTHTCVIMDTGALLCWGYDGQGQTSGVFSGYPQTVICP